jgi:hypothetical protein
LAVCSSGLQKEKETIRIFSRVAFVMVTLRRPTAAKRGGDVGVTDIAFGGVEQLL